MNKKTQMLTSQSWVGSHSGERTYLIPELLWLILPLASPPRRTDGVRSQQSWFSSDLVQSPEVMATLAGLLLMNLKNQYGSRIHTSCLLLDSEWRKGWSLTNQNKGLKTQGNGLGIRRLRRWGSLTVVSPRIWIAKTPWDYSFLGFLSWQA